MILSFLSCHLAKKFWKQSQSKWTKKKRSRKNNFCPLMFAVLVSFKKIEGGAEIILLFLGKTKLNTTLPFCLLRAKPRKIGFFF